MSTKLKNSKQGHNASFYRVFNCVCCPLKVCDFGLPTRLMTSSQLDVLSDD